jgi:hypothetical protein
MPSRRRIMKTRSARASRLILTVLFLAALLVGAAAAAGAQAKTILHFKGVNTEISSSFNPVGDPAEGHFVGVSVRRGLAIFENGEVGMAASVEYIDVLRGAGTTTGYVTVTFEDGASFTAKIDNHFTIGAKGLVVATIKTDYVKGTGRFEGIKGGETATARQITTAKDFAGFTVVDGTATFTLPR